MAETLTAEGALDSIRISDAEAQGLLDELDSLTLPKVTKDKRQATRVATQANARVITQMWAEGGKPVTYITRPRNISRTGMAILHGGYVHNGVRCRVLLRIGGEQVSTDAQVVRCRYLGGSIHEVGIRFEMPLMVA